MTSVFVDRVTLLDPRAAKGRRAGLVAFFHLFFLTVA
jgi:hypothetical protein